MFGKQTRESTLQKHVSLYIEREKCEAQCSVNLTYLVSGQETNQQPFCREVNQLFAATSEDAYLRWNQFITWEKLKTFVKNNQVKIVAYITQRH